MAHKSWSPTPDPRCADDRLQALEAVSVRDAAVGRVLWIVLFLNLAVAAIKLVVGDLGTYAGIVTDENARALDAEGRVIPGLYAAGNDMASIMGGNYPGAGITLGPALTFGYIAGKHLARANL